VKLLDLQCCGVCEEAGFEVLKRVCTVLHGVITATIQCLYFGSEHLHFQESSGKLKGARELAVVSVRDYGHLFAEGW